MNLKCLLRSDWKRKCLMLFAFVLILVLGTLTARCGVTLVKPSPKSCLGLRTCSSDAVKAAVRDRATGFVFNTLRDAERFANDTSLALAVAGNPANFRPTNLPQQLLQHRFGAVCADEGVEGLLSQLGGWQLLDTRRVSLRVWQTQMEDGLHIDRRFAHTGADHRAQRQKCESEQRPCQGMLETQIAQSLLHLIFHSALKTLYG